jgi:hypothetical protein
VGVRYLVFPRAQSFQTALYIDYLLVNTIVKDIFLSPLFKKKMVAHLQLALLVIHLRDDSLVLVNLSIQQTQLAPQIRLNET